MSEIPKGWQNVALGELLREPLRNGHSARATSDPDGIRTLTLTAVTVGDFSEENTKITSADPKRVSNLWLEPGDLLIERSNTPELVGTTRLYRGPRDFAIFPDLVIRARVGDQTDPRFIELVLQSLTLRRYFQGRAKGMAGSMPKIDQQTISEAPIPLPPLPEQRRIVARIEELFSRLDAGVAALRHAKAQLQRYRQSVLAAAVTGQLTQAWREQHPNTEPAEELLERILEQRRENWSGRGKFKEPESPDASALADLPASWLWTSIGQAFDVHVGATPTRKEPAYWNGDVPWVSSGEVAFCRIRKTAEQITQEGLTNASTTLHPPGTVMVGMIGEGKTRGQAAILEIEACHNQNSAAIRVSMSPVLPEYVYHYLVHQYEDTRRASSGGNQPALNKRRVQAIPLPLPPLAEQHQIVAEVEARTTAIDHLEAELNRQITRSNRLRQSTLSSAFSGKL